MGNVISLSDLAAEGLPTDQRVETVLIPLAEAALEKATGFRFYSHAATFALDGSGLGVLVLPQPAIALTSVLLATSTAPLVVGTDYVLRNRRPPDVDDRLSPRVERVSSTGYAAFDAPSRYAGVVWPLGAGNVTVAGTFGFTDLIGGAELPPPEVRRCCVRLVAYELARLGDLDDLMARKLGIYGRSFESISLAGVEPGVGFGVPEIDSVIARYSHPAHAAHPKFAFGGA